METKKQIFFLRDSETGEINGVESVVGKPNRNGDYTAHCYRPDKHNNGDKNPSLSVNPGKGVYLCRVCGCKGIVLPDEQVTGVVTVNAAHKQMKIEIVPSKEKEEKTLSMQEAVIRANELIKTEIPEPKLILKPWITEESITLISGWRGTGKTWFSLGIASYLTMGNKFFGPWEIVNPIPVLYVDGEMSLYSMQQRLNLLGHEENKEKAPLFIYSNALANAKGLPSTSLYKSEHREAIKEICKVQGIRVLILDNISSLAPGEDENAKKEWDPINQWLLSLRFLGVSTLMLHHEGKSGTQRGTSGKEDNVDHSIRISHPNNYSVDEGIRFRVNFTKNRIDNDALHLITEMEFKGMKVDGKLYLMGEKVIDDTKKRLIKERLTQGEKVKEIEAELGVSERYIYKVKREALNN
jgi:putative DNA primase/helicase